MLIAETCRVRFLRTEGNINVENVSESITFGRIDLP